MLVPARFAQFPPSGTELLSRRIESRVLRVNDRTHGSIFANKRVTSGSLGALQPFSFVIAKVLIVVVGIGVSIVGPTFPHARRLDTDMYSTVRVWALRASIASIFRSPPPGGRRAGCGTRIGLPLEEREEPA